MNRRHRFFTLPSRERWILVEAAACLAFARLGLCVPFRWLVPMIGRPQRASGTYAAMLQPDARDIVISVRHALKRVADGLPWHSTCLVCAIAGRIMLRRRRLPSVLHLGVAPGAASFSAHAWLRCGDVVVAGAEGVADYAPIVGFEA